jgi:hypothetical protein
MKIVTHPGSGRIQHDDSREDHHETKRPDRDAPREVAARPTAHERTDSHRPSPRNADNPAPAAATGA